MIDGQVTSVFLARDYGSPSSCGLTALAHAVQTLSSWYDPG
jgi:hypothetical protein